MAEPTTSTTAALLLGISAGALGAVLSSLGLTHGLLVYGAVGSIVGMMFAPEASRWRAATTFLSASILSAKAGSVSAEVWFGASANIGQGLAAFAGVFFHPGVQAVATSLPEFLRKRFA